MELARTFNPFQRTYMKECPCVCDKVRQVTMPLFQRVPNRVRIFKVLGVLLVFCLACYVMIIAGTSGIMSTQCSMSQMKIILREKTNDANAKAIKIGKMEFPRMYNSPPCDPAKNKTIKEAVCMLLGAIIDERERQVYLRLLTYFDGLATKHNWTYFLNFGTLLGSWRHHGFVPYDMDVDLYIDYAHRKQIVNIMEEQKRFIPKQMVSDQIKIYDSEGVFGGAYYENVGRWWAPCLDCWFYKQDATHLWESDSPTSHIMKKSDVFPTQKRPFEGMMLPAPRDTLKILKDMFGDTTKCHRYASGYEPVDCKELKQYFPFVHRAILDGKVEERLVLGNKVLQSKLLNAPLNSLPVNPYTLETKPPR